MSQVTITKEMLQALNLSESANTETITLALKNLVATAAKVPVLEAKARDLEAQANKADIDEILQQAKTDRKITTELQAVLETDYANNPEGLRSLVATMPAYKSIQDLSSSKTRSLISAPNEESWTWEDYEKKDPAGKKLRDLKATDPDTYQRLYTERYFKPKENWHDDIVKSKSRPTC